MNLCACEMFPANKQLILLIMTSGGLPPRPVSWYWPKGEVSLVFVSLCSPSVPRQQLTNVPSGLCWGPRWRCRQTGCCWIWRPQTLPDRFLPWCQHEQREKRSKRETAVALLTDWKRAPTWQSDCTEACFRGWLPCRRTCSSRASVPPVGH